MSAPEPASRTSTLTLLHRGRAQTRQRGRSAPVCGRVIAARVFGIGRRRRPACHHSAAILSTGMAEGILLPVLGGTDLASDSTSVRSCQDGSAQTAPPTQHIGKPHPTYPIVNACPVHPCLQSWRPIGSDTARATNTRQTISSPQGRRKGLTRGFAGLR